MPMVLRMLRDVTGKEPNCSLPPGEAVAHGAAIHAAIKAVDLWQAKAHVSPGLPLPPLISAEPSAVAENVADSANDDAPRDAFSGIEPIHEHVAMGHGLHAADDWDDHDSADDSLTDEATRDELLEAVLSDETIDLEMGDVHDEDDMAEDPSAHFDPAVRNTLRRVKKTDVNAHSLGVIVTRSLGGRGKSILIPRNSPLPASATKIYGTMKENQPEVVIRILEGESPYVDECTMLGTCRITDLPIDLIKGSPVEVTFTLDDSGRLHVRAVEMTSGQFVTTTIQCESGISREKIDSAREALEHISVV